MTEQESRDLLKNISIQLMHAGNNISVSNYKAFEAALAAAIVLDDYLEESADA